MSHASEIALVLLLPLIGAVVNLSMPFKQSYKISGVISAATTLMAAILSYCLWSSCFAPAGSPTPASADHVITHRLDLWELFPSLQLSCSFLLSPLTAVMAMLVTGVGGIITIFAIDYMKEDEHQQRFFGVLSLFIFAMLVLVLSSNLLVMFAGWEGVGVCSYLLIGFWHREMKNALAAQKAFVVNRIGDAGFMVGMLLLLATLGTLEFETINAASRTLPAPLITLITLALFVGAMGKSAQLPLHTWLPDAMAGPTPVSALIHAATMVTAGVFLCVRLAPLFALSPTVLLFIGSIGSLTAIFAACCALYQRDIKKVLAFSTLSQLGLMFIAVGSGSFEVGLFHVVTHAFFKALLFLGAGAILISLHHEQNLFFMGGLRSKMPVVFWTFVIGSLALSGFWGTSGYFSKEEILLSTVVSPTVVQASAGSTAGEPQESFGILGFSTHDLWWAAAMLTSLLTGVYMARLVALIFFHNYRGSSHPHHLNLLATGPLVILAIPSIFFGYLFGQPLLEMVRPDLATVAIHQPAVHADSAAGLKHLLMNLLPLAFPLSLFFFSRPQGERILLRESGWFSSGFFEAAGYIDALYEKVIIHPLRRLATLLLGLVEMDIIEGAATVSGEATSGVAELVRRTHVGTLSWLLLISVGCALFLIIFWVLL